MNKILNMQIIIIFFSELVKDCQKYVLMMQYSKNLSNNEYVIIYCKNN